MDWRDVRRVHARLFPERQLIFRSEGRVRYVVLSRTTQSLAACIIATLALWVLFSTSYVLVGTSRIASREIKIADLASSNRDLERELRAVRTRFTSAASDLETKHRQLIDLLSYKDIVEQRLSAITAQMESVSGEHREASGEVVRLRRELDEQREQLLQRLGAAPGRGANDQRSSADTEMNEARARLAAVRNEREVLAKKEGTNLVTDIDRVTDRLSAVRREQLRLLEQILSRTERDIGELETAISRTGFKPDRLMAAGRARGVGGPLVALRPATEAAFPEGEIVEFEDDPEFDGQLSAVEDRLGRWEALQDLFLVLPLANPVDNSYMSSEFGFRRDPFTNRPAFHAGTDFTGPGAQAVFATAPGRVTFVGRNGPFGKMVEVDHGFGLTSRYAHLNKTAVDVGQQIGLREEIGHMGSTGRSTGAHLHYEIRFNGTALDPGHFLRVGSHLRGAQATPRAADAGSHVLKK
jgi:murein DD-endopeptidase MepM/ murein hydrolase activator NlpD